MNFINILQQFHNHTNALLKPSKKEKENKVAFKVEVAGLRYNQQDAIYHHLHQGTALRLVREYNNPFDAKAVAIYYQNFKIGYIPRAYNITISRMLDRGFVLSTSILSIQKEKYLPADSILLTISDQNIALH